MKKLLFASILLSVFQLAAQNHLAISLITGPNGIKVFAEEENTNYLAGLGWGSGADCNIGINQRWELKIGWRYLHADGVAERHNLMYESEYSTGTYVYDPALPHDVQLKYQDNLLQYLLGARFYFNDPKTWRWYVDAEFGSASRVKNKRQPDNQKYLSGGLGIGLQWLTPSQRFGVFAQPGLRYLTSIRQYNWERRYALVIPAIEIGLRIQLFLK